MSSMSQAITRLSLYQPFGVSYVLLFPLHMYLFLCPLCLSLCSHCVSAFCGWRCSAMCLFSVFADQRCLQGMVCDWKKCIVCTILNVDSQRYRTDVNPLMTPSGLDCLREEGESLFEDRWYREKYFILIIYCHKTEPHYLLTMKGVLSIQWGYTGVLGVFKISGLKDY